MSLKLPPLWREDADENLDDLEEDVDVVDVVRRRPRSLLEEELDFECDAPIFDDILETFGIV